MIILSAYTESCNIESAENVCQRLK